jgi:GT2 family glycosyltransferase
MKERIVAIMVVRNEADLLPVNVRYHAAQGVTEFRIVDNGSSDATTTRLRELSRSFRILPVTTVPRRPS